MYTIETKIIPLHMYIVYSNASNDTPLYTHLSVVYDM